MEDDDIQLLDTDNFVGERSEEFSHSQLVMKCMKKCIELGCKEMREGYMNEKADRFGNIVRTYIEDTRKAFIEAVKTTQMIMFCDYDTETKKNIETYEKSIDIEYKRLCGEEDDQYNKDQSDIPYHFKGTLNKNMPFYQEYLECSLSIYRKIFSELTLLTNRINYYKEEMVKA
jgi:hypothetical protein